MRHPVVRAGLIFGLIVGVLRAADLGAGVAVELVFGNQLSDPQIFASQALPYLLLISLASFLLFFVALALYLLAGVFAARETGGVGSGSIAGLIAGAIAGVIGAAITIGVYASGLNPTTSSLTTPADPSASTVLLIFAIMSSVVGIALDIGFGAGMGALGGLIGKSAYEKGRPAPAAMPGMYVPPWVYAPGAYPPPYWAPSPYPPYAPYPQAGAQWPGEYPPPMGYPPPPPRPTTDVPDQPASASERSLDH